MQWTQLNAQAPGAPSWAEQVDAALRSGVQGAATALRQACNVDGVVADSPPAPSGQPYQQAHGSQAPAVQLATGFSSTAHKAKRARGRDGDRVIKTTQWCAQAVLVYTPPLAGQAIDQQLTSTAHDHRLQQLGAAAAGPAGTSRASICIYRHGRRAQADEDTLDMVVTALKRVKYAEFGLQLVSFSTHMDSAQACLGATCVFKQLSSRASEAPIAAACIRAIAINIFNLHLVQAAPGEQPAQPLDPEPRPDPDIATSAGMQRRLVKDAMKAALADLKAASNGAFGLSRLEARLNVCLPVVCASACSILRNAVSPHLLPFAKTMLGCGGDGGAVSTCTAGMGTQADADGLQAAMLLACHQACKPQRLPASRQTDNTAELTKEPGRDVLVLGEGADDVSAGGGASPERQPHQSPWDGMAIAADDEPADFDQEASANPDHHLQSQWNGAAGRNQAKAAGAADWTRDGATSGWDSLQEYAVDDAEGHHGCDAAGLDDGGDDEGWLF